MDHNAIARLAARQHGVVQTSQLGLHPMAWKRLTTGWLKAHPGIYIQPGAQMPMARLFAALLWGGPDAVLSHRRSIGWTGWRAHYPR